jgi:hypothetical protein
MKSRTTELVLLLGAKSQIPNGAMTRIPGVEGGETLNKNALIAIVIIAVLALPILASLCAESLQPVLSPGPFNRFSPPSPSPQPMIPAPLPPSPSTVFPGATAYYSYNWGGYAVLTSGTNKVTDVKGSWTVPTYTGATCNPDEWWDSSFWVGIDGFSSSTVEQIGTDTYCYEGTVGYEAWYEMYPASSVPIHHPVSAGDVMSAEVKYIGSNKFTLSISDATAVWSFSVTKTQSAKRNSAEWIAESPFGDMGELPLANFGTAYFTSDTAVTTKHTGVIGSFPANQIAVITAACYPSGSPDKSETSALSDGGTGGDFSIEYLNPGPEG